MKGNRPFSYSKKESGSNDTSLHFVEFSNTHNSAIEALTHINRASCIKMYRNIAQSRLFCRIAKRSIGRWKRKKEKGPCLMKKGLCLIKKGL